MSFKTQLTLPVLKSVLYGLAIGDALGVPVEFSDRSERKEDPVTDYRGYGTHNVPAGTWSDDTSMALAALHSHTKGLDYDDVMREFCRWRYHDAYTATGIVFDQGITVHHALQCYRSGTDPLSCGSKNEMDNGNGSLMRIAPTVFYTLSRMPEEPESAHLDVIHKCSCLTHGHARSRMGCGIYYFLLKNLLTCPSDGVTAVRVGLRQAKAFYEGLPEFAGETAYDRLFQPSFSSLPEEEIQSSGYVVHTLEAAVWCLLNTSLFSDCVLKAVNLGKDTDTVGAVAGSLAGAMYGLDAIPAHWIEGLLRHEMIDDLCSEFLNAGQGATAGTLSHSTDK